MAVMVMFVMTVPVTVTVMSVPFKINTMPSFNVVGAACIDLNIYPRRCRHIAGDADIHVGRTR